MKNWISLRIALRTGAITLLALSHLIINSVNAQVQDLPSLKNQDTNELALVQGKWYWDQELGGRKLHTEKESIGNRTILKTYDEYGEVVYGHVCEFKVEKQGPVKIFTFWNLVDTDGPNKGKFSFKKPYSFIYRIRENGDFTEVHGFLNDERRLPELRIWRRVKD
jgi:hypothetical protein